MERLRVPGSVAQTAMRTDGVVMPPPGLDQHLGLGETVEDLAVEQLIAKRPVEALVVAVLSRRTGRDVKRPGAYRGARHRPGVARRLQPRSAGAGDQAALPQGRGAELLSQCRTALFSGRIPKAAGRAGAGRTRRHVHCRAQCGPIQRPARGAQSTRCPPTPTLAGPRLSSNSGKGSTARPSNIGACSTASSPPNINPQTRSTLR